MSSFARLSVAIFAASVSVFAQAPWNAPPFSVQPQELVRAAAAVTVDAGLEAVVLADNMSYSFDERGRETRTIHRIYKVLSAAAVDGWSDVETRWEPWHEQRPAIRARVIAPDGRVTQLDARTVAELPVDDSDGTLSDARILHAPLPAVAAGSLIEEETRVVESEAVASAGTVLRAYFGYFGVPAIYSSLTLSAPRSARLQAVPRLLLQAVMERSENGGRTQIRVTQGRMEPLDDTEPFQPFDMPRTPQVEFSTGASWEAVATAYHRLSDPQIRPSDVQALVASADIAGKPRLEVANLLLKLLHERIRYTGLEFAEAAIVPRTPRETLERQYGDCKDQAAMLVAMLRAAGIPAHLALLNSGFGQDVSADLPGFGLFNHAIVYAPGEPDLWADPTDPFSRFGELPSSDQGRWALVARENGPLIKIPEAVPAANLITELREFYLAERGAARVVEVTEPHGAIESSYRSSYQSPDNADVKEELAGYAESQYLAEGDPKLTFSAAADLNVPFRLTIEMDKASRGTTDDTEAVVAIPAGWLLGRLPDLFLEDDDEDAKPRRADLMVGEPFINEWRYKIVPPPGYKAAPLPEDRDEKWGPAAFRREFKVEADGSVTALFRFDAGKRRYTAAEFEETRKAARAMRQEPTLFVRFIQAGEEMVASGQIREAIQEFNRLRALHPDESLHREQFAKALLAAGAGEAAGQEARAAVAAAPDDPNAHRTLAWILQHDTIGRRFGKGADLEGAAAAYRKAIELEPKESITRLNYGVLLEHLPNGQRYESVENLNLAVEQYRIAREEEGELEPGFDQNLAANLLRAGRFEDAEKEGRERSGANANAVLLTAIAARSGVRAALNEAARLRGTDQDRRVAIATAAQSMIALRRYDLAAELLDAAAQGTPQAAAMRQRSDTIRKTERVDLSTAPPAATPFDAVRRLFTLMFLPSTRAETLLAEISVLNPERDVADVQRVFGQMAQVRSQMAQQGLPFEALADLLIAQMTGNTEGDDAGGYRVRLEMPGGNGPTRIVAFVIREDGRYKILDMDEGPPLGVLALRQLDGGNLALARRPLDWAREILQPAGGDDPLAGSVFARMWTRGGDADRDAMRYAAAVLIAEGPKPASAIPLLLEGREKATSDQTRLLFDLALLNAYKKTANWDEMLKLAEPVLVAYPLSDTALSSVTAALQGLKRWDRIEALIAERLGRTPGDHEVLALACSTALAAGNYSRAIEIGKQIVADGRATPTDLNNIAWSALYVGPVDKEIVDLAQRAGQAAGTNYGILHTLAAVYAEAGMTSEARQSLLQAMENGGREEPGESDWYVLGRIAEQYGLTEAARAYYGKLTRPQGDDFGTSWLLAQRRLQAMAAGN